MFAKYAHFKEVTSSYKSKNTVNQTSMQPSSKKCPNNTKEH